MPEPVPAQAIIKPEALSPLRAALAVAGLLAALFVVYWPAIHGEMLWDDDGHVTRESLRSIHGLWRTWFELGATQQYYPLVHSVFWIEHRLWGDNTLGYHIINILMHATAACLFYLVLRRLKIPGAWLAWLIFALHPIQVETVAWITELKNTQSAVFYFAAALLYLKFDGSRRWWQYALALFLFVCGLLSKSVIATLPAALLVVFWWQRGTLSWKRDILPVIPWLIIGAASGLFTAYVEHEEIGAKGNDFAFSIVQRLLVAGRVPWFYFSKIIWPVRLSFMYPRWNVDPALLWQFLFPIATAAVLLSLWCRRGNSRAMLAGAFFFIGTLFPVLGFFNVYPFLFSYVADHFQYLAMIGVIVPISAGLMLLVGRLRSAHRGMGHVVLLLMVALLSLQSRLQSRMYVTREGLYRGTLDRNPECWLALSNLGNILRDRNNYDEAKLLYAHALAIRPKAPLTLNSLGVLYLQIDNPVAAGDAFRRSIAAQENDTFPLPHSNLGMLNLKEGNYTEAVKEFKRTVEMVPDSAEAYNNLGAALLQLNESREAIVYLRKAVELKTDYAEAYNNLGVALAMGRQFAESIDPFEKAMKYQAEYAEAAVNLARAYAAVGRYGDALATAEQALQWAHRQQDATQIARLEARIAEYRRLSGVP